jgi:phage gp16-like protein
VAETREEKRRRAELAMIHLAKKQLGMTDEDYRAMLHNIAGTTSSAHLNTAGRSQIIEHLKKCGFKPLIRVKRTGKPPGNPTQTGKIEQLWKELAKTGILRDSSRRALSAFLLRRTSVAEPNWLTPEQASDIIEALKAWLKRAGSLGGRNGVVI